MLSVIYLATVEAADKTLILHLPFDEGSGKKAADKSSYGHHAELIANYKWVPGKFGKAVEIANKQSADNIKTKAANTLKIGIINKTPDEIKNLGYCFPVLSCILLAQITNNTTKAIDPTKE